MPLNKMHLTFLLLATSAILIDVYFEVNFPKVERAVVTSDRLRSGAVLKVLHISDVHGYNQNNFILKAVRDAAPDLIVITGDLIDKKTSSFEDLYQLADQLVLLNPNVFFVSGNHEGGNHHGREFVNTLTDKKFQVLNNSNTAYIKDGTPYTICGINDHYTGQDDLESAFQGIHRESYTLLLSHSPTVIRSGKSMEADLILSGHAHGGQVRFPFIGALIAPGEGLFPKYNKGFYYFDNTVMYVNSGLGTSSLPLRFLNRSQISLIEIRSSQ